MSPTRDVMAVIGGMGPLASAEFVNTVYQRATFERDQDAPSLLLWSDPTFPDRTTELLEGRAHVLADCLRNAIEQCCAMGATQVVIACMTMHSAVPLLPPHLSDRIVSLVDVLLNAAIEARRPHLIMSSLGTRRVHVLENHPLWPEASRFLIWPDEQDQQRVHAAIYAVKRNNGVPGAIALLESLLQRYGLDAFAAACTEWHIVQKQWARRSPMTCLDPLDIIADRFIAAGAVSDRAVAQRAGA